MKTLHLILSIIGLALFAFSVSLAAARPTLAQNTGRKDRTSKITPVHTAPYSADEAGVDAISDYEAARGQELYREDYEKLEKLAAELRSSKARFPGGAWKLHKLYQGIDRPVSVGKVSEQEWILHLPKLQKWVAQYPKSITARVALASAFTEYAWSARGDGFASTVSEDGRRLFGERLMVAEKILTEAKALPEKCPHWYATMETVAMGRGWERSRFDSLFEEAVEYEPQYHYFYTYKANYLLPRWHGEAGEMEKFADETAVRLGGKFGSIVYYLIASEMSPRYRTRMFFETRLSWPRIM